MKRYVIRTTIFTAALIRYLSAADPQWERTGGPLGGLGYDVRMRPDNPDMMYVTDAYAGVFISENGGEHWFPSNEGISTRTGDSGDAIPVFCLTIDPHNYDIIWIGTQFKRGIFKSMNAGFEWKEMVNGIKESEGITFRGFTVDPTSSDIVYAAAELSSWAWNSTALTGREFDKTMGVVYKTTNGGESWSEIWRGNNLARYIWIHPKDPDIIYISTGIFDREAADSDALTDTPGGEGVVKSTDGGKTWKNVNTGMENLYVGSLFMNPEDPNVLLAGTGNNAYGKGQGVYLTENGGDSWELVLDDNINSVEFSSSEPTIAYAGSANAIYRSENRGASWEQMTESFTWGAEGVRAGFPIDFQVDPGNDNRIFTNNYGGGNFLSVDGGKTWTVASQGYTGAQARDIAVDPENPARIFCAARSGIFISSNGGSEWRGLNFEPADVLEWNAIAIDPLNPQHIFCGTNWNARLMESQSSGSEWQVSKINLPSGNGFKSLVYAPSDAQVVYAGTSAFLSAGVFDATMDASGIAVSKNNGNDWSWINDENSDDANIQQLAVDPKDPDNVFAATSNNGLLKTVNGGTTWSQLTKDLPSSKYFSMVAIHPANPKYVFTGVQGTGLYRSEDGGDSWKMIAAGLILEMKITDLVFDPTDPDILYLSDLRSGVYRSANGGDSWVPLNDELRTRAVNALAISSDGQHLYAATEGEGVFRLDFSALPVSVDHYQSIPLAFNLKLNYPNPFNLSTCIEYTLPHTSDVTILIFNAIGQEVYSVQDMAQTKGNHRLNWNGTNHSGEVVPTGIYVCCVTAESNGRTVSSVIKMVLLK